MSEKDKKLPLVPPLRFPDFQDAGMWTTVELGNLSQLVTERVGATTCTPYTITSGVGLVSQKKKLGRTIAGDSLKNYIVLQRNDFAYNKSATKAYPQGFIALYVEDDRAAVPNSIFTCFRVDRNKTIPAFLDKLFSFNLHGKWLRNRIAVGARAHGSLQVNNDDLMAIPVPLPSGSRSLAEQQRIADCLTTLDGLITAETQKLDALKTHKKGLMQQLFPRVGENQPHLRLLDEGNWIIASLPEVVFFQEGPGIMAADFRSEGVPLVRLAGVGGTTVTLDGCNYLDPEKVARKWAHFRLEPNDLIISTSATFGLTSSVTEVAAGAVFYTGLIRFRPSNGRVVINYLKEFLGSPHFEQQAASAAVGGGIKHFGPTHLKQMEIPIPPLAEQHRIADCLGSLDARIADEARKLEALKLHKEGLIQQLFPALDEVSA